VQCKVTINNLYGKINVVFFFFVVLLLLVRVLLFEVKSVLFLVVTELGMVDAVLLNNKIGYFVQQTKLVCSTKQVSLIVGGKGRGDCSLEFRV